jgi:hypothetical protein
MPMIFAPAAISRSALLQETVARLCRRPRQVTLISRTRDLAAQRAGMGASSPGGQSRPARRILLVECA